MSKDHDLVMVNLIEWLEKKLPIKRIHVEFPVETGVIDIYATLQKETEEFAEKNIFEIKTDSQEGVTEAIRQLKKYRKKILNRGSLVEYSKIMGSDEIRKKTCQFWLVTNYNINKLKKLLELENIGWIFMNPKPITLEEQKIHLHAKKYIQEKVIRKIPQNTIFPDKNK